MARIMLLRPVVFCTILYLAVFIVSWLTYKGKMTSSMVPKKVRDDPNSLFNKRGRVVTIIFFGIITAAFSIAYGPMFVDFITGNTKTTTGIVVKIDSPDVVYPVHLDNDELYRSFSNPDYLEIGQEYEIVYTPCSKIIVSYRPIE